MFSFRPSFLWIALLFGALCFPLILSNRISNYTGDETSYYMPAIEQIRSHWPSLDLVRDSLSATAPGYSYALATLSRATGATVLPMRLATFAVSLVLLWLLWRCFPTGQKPLATVSLLVLACSNFYVKSASWVVTDNAALLAVTSTLLCILFGTRRTSLVWGGMFAAVATFTRQNCIWVAAPLAWVAWRESAAPEEWRSRLYKWIPVLAPFLVLVILISAWGGLVPAAWRETQYPHEVNFMAPLVYALGVLGCMGGFFYATVAGENWRSEACSPWPCVGAGLGLVAALAGQTSFSMSAGRWGGYLWMLAGKLPAPCGRSFVFLILTPIGGAVAALLLRRIWAESSMTAAGAWTCACAAWGAAQMANREVFHRYYEPAILILLIVWLSSVLRARPQKPPFRWQPLAALAAIQLSLTLLIVYQQVYGGHLPS